MLVRSKLFPQFVEKIEKLKLCLSKPHHEIRKIRSEMLKIKKKQQNNQAQEKFPGIFRIPEIPMVFEIRKVKNPGNRETLVVVCLLVSVMKILRPVLS